MALDKRHHYSTRTLDGPNWKVVIDGYLEGYHFASLHRTPSSGPTCPTSPPSTAGGRTSATRSRCGRSPTRSTCRASSGTRPCASGAIYWLFPGCRRRRLALQVASRSCCPAPPGTPRAPSRSSRCATSPQTTSERKAAEHTRDWFHDVVIDEDYLTGYGVQRGLAALSTAKS